MQQLGEGLHPLKHVIVISNSRRRSVVDVVRLHANTDQCKKPRSKMTGLNNCALWLTPTSTTARRYNKEAG